MGIYELLLNKKSQHAIYLYHLYLVIKFHLFRKILGNIVFDRYSLGYL